MDSRSPVIVPRSPQTAGGAIVFSAKDKLRAGATLVSIAWMVDGLYSSSLHSNAKSVGRKLEVSLLKRMFAAVACVWLTGSCISSNQVGAAEEPVRQGNQPLQ